MRKGRSKLTRRRVLIAAAAIAGGGLALSWLRPDPRKARLAVSADVLEPSAFLQLSPSGEIVVQVDKAELGQGLMTAYVTLIAEELDVPPARITPRFAGVHPLFQDPTQVTSESASTRRRWMLLRTTGAAARAMLLEAAAREWQVGIAELDTDGTGHVVHAASGRRVGYAQLATAAAALPVPQEPPLRTRRSFRWIGKYVPRVDTPAKVQGAATYGIDVRVPGMRIAAIARSHAFGGVLVGYAADAARALPGVHAVLEIPTGVAVIADSSWHAERGVAALNAAVSAGTSAGLGTAAVHAGQRERLSSEAGDRVRDDGDADALLEPGDGLIEAEYELPYLAHAPLEPMNCTVAIRDDSAEVWAPNQGADLVRQVVCDLSGIARERITVHSTYCGGGFGRRAILDFVAEATAIAMQVDYPVKLVWSRRDDLRNSWFRQATVHRLSARLGAKQQPLAWRHRLVAASLVKHVLPVILPILLPDAVPRPLRRRLASGAGAIANLVVGPFQARDGAETMPYAVPNVAVDIIAWDPGIPIGIWRSVGNSYNGFVVESFVDELAHAAGADPAQYRRGLLAAQPRHRAVLDALVARAGWGKVSTSRAQGIALHGAFGSVVGQVAEVSVEQGRIRVHRVTCVVDCGFAINPDIVRQQMESGIIFGLTAALYGEVPIENGRALVNNFDDYRMLKLDEAPEIDVHIVESNAPLAGVGELGVPPIAPAVANAVFRATGQRLRKLPLRLG